MNFFFFNLNFNTVQGSFSLFLKNLKQLFYAQTALLVSLGSYFGGYSMIYRMSLTKSICEIIKIISSSTNYYNN